MVMFLPVLYIFLLWHDATHGYVSADHNEVNVLDFDVKRSLRSFTATVLKIEAASEPQLLDFEPTRFSFDLCTMLGREGLWRQYGSSFCLLLDNVVLNTLLSTIQSSRCVQSLVIN